jgi:Ni/Co efflux regulator RcnB
MAREEGGMERERERERASTWIICEETVKVQVPTPSSMAINGSATADISPGSSRARAQTDRQTDRKTDRQSDRHRQTDRHTQDISKESHTVRCYHNNCGFRMHAHACHTHYYLRGNSEKFRKGSGLKEGLQRRIFRV